MHLSHGPAEGASSVQGSVAAWQKKAETLTSDVASFTGGQVLNGGRT